MDGALSSGRDERDRYDRRDRDRRGGGRRERDGDRRRRDDEKRRREAAALAALPPPKLPPPPKRVPALPTADLLGRAVRVVIADAPSDTRGTVDSVAHGVCRVAWADGSTSDVLAADVTAMLVPLVV